MFVAFIVYREGTGPDTVQIIAAEPTRPQALAALKDHLIGWQQADGYPQAEIDEALQTWNEEEGQTIWSDEEAIYEIREV